MSVESGRRSSPLLMTLPLAAVLAVAGLTWAKWWPYTLKLQGVLSDRSWTGTSILSSGGDAGAVPSLAGGWNFTLAYGKAVWKALVVALLLAAAVETLVPRRRLMAALSGRGAYGGALAGGLLSLPCMMCTCCTAPLARTLRRNGAPTSSVLAYWLGNPTLNPAVLAFLAIVAPWQWFAVRLLAGAVLVFGVTVVIGRLAGRDATSAVPAVAEEEEMGAAGIPRRFAGALGRLSLTLVPEYAVVVFAIGTFRGWIFPLDGGAGHWAIPALVAAATLGTLVVIPTAGEIPILLGLAAAGAGTGILGVLLITLPAISLPSMAMVVRSLSLRVTLATAAGVAATGLTAGGLLRAIG